jgi:hypothetical protein
MKNYESKSEQTGNIFEWQFIGEIDTSSREYQKELHKLQEEAAQKGSIDGHIPYKKAVELATKFQPFDPTHPNKPFARDVRISLLDLMISKGMITDSEDDQDRIKFYTSVKTPLDVFHGIDAFVQFKDSNEKKYLITFDLTLNTQKKEYKSDIIVNKLPDPNLDEEKIQYLAVVEQYAQKALDCIEIKKAPEENNK